ncbi:MAG: orotidine-5'-phosphate decarboxylase [Hyphomicrobiales bacterium]
MTDFDVKNPSPKDRLIVPLDVPSLSDARDVVTDLGDAVSFYKVGFQILYAGGFDLISELKDAGKQVFIDLKLLDIDNTVKSGVESLAALGGTFLTIHAYPHAMRAAVEGRGTSDLKLLAVTVMTNLDDALLQEAGYKESAHDLVLKRAVQARDTGIEGVICSAAEASAIRAAAGPDLLLVTPGIRPANAAADDQKRIMTPRMAIENGSDYLVVGRPILKAENRRAAASAIVEEIEAALS